MNITFQTNNFNSQYRAHNQNQYKNNVNPTFGKSPFLAPWKRFVDKSTDQIAKYYTANLYQSGLTKFIAKQADKLNSVVDHMQVLGSIVISGMYMEQTLTNKNLDPEKRKTLAINQGLTFLASTILSYFIDKKLDDKWEKLTRKYTVANLEFDRMQNMTSEQRKAYRKEKLEELNRKINEWNIARKLDFEAKVKSGELSADRKFKVGNVSDYISKKMPDSKLSNRIKGMGILKKLLVFGTIYRFISPVAVTPIANWIGNKYIYKSDNDTNAKKA